MELLLVEEGVEVDEALHVEAHLLFAMHEVDADKAPSVGQRDFPFGVFGQQKIYSTAVCVAQIIDHNGVTFILPGVGHHGELHPAGVGQFPLQASAARGGEVFGEGQLVQHPARHQAGAVPDFGFLLALLHVGDGHIVGREEAADKMGPHQARDTLGEDKAALFERELQPGLVQKLLGVHAVHVQIRHLVAIDPAQRRRGLAERVGNSHIAQFVHRLDDNAPGAPGLSQEGIHRSAQRCLRPNDRIRQAALFLYICATTAADRIPPRWAQGVAAWCTLAAPTAHG